MSNKRKRTESYEKVDEEIELIRKKEEYFRSIRVWKVDLWFSDGPDEWTWPAILAVISQQLRNEFTMIEGIELPPPESFVTHWQGMGDRGFPAMKLWIISSRVKLDQALRIIASTGVHILTFDYLEYDHNKTLPWI